MTIKKILTTLLLSQIIIASAIGATNAADVCRIVNLYRISGPSGIQIQGTPSTEDHLEYIKTSNTIFAIKCYGILHIDIGTDDAKHVCKLSIDYESAINSPTITSDCAENLNYDGYDHNYGTAAYTLKFSENNTP